MLQFSRTNLPLISLSSMIAGFLFLSLHGKAQVRTLYFRSEDTATTRDSAQFIKKGTIEGNKYLVIEYKSGDTMMLSRAYYLDSSFLTKDSLYLEYYDYRQGLVKTRGQYSLGNKTGTWITVSGDGLTTDSLLYTNSGHLYFQFSSYDNGKKETLVKLDAAGNGTETGYWESGALDYLGTYKDWKKEGIWKYYDENHMLRDQETMHGDSVTLALYYDERGKNPVPHKPPYTSKPEYPGGYARWNDYVQRSIEERTMPQVYQDGNFEGSIQIAFAVDEHGNVVDARVRRGVLPAMDAIMVQIGDNSLGWIPARNHNRIMKDFLIQSFNFQKARPDTSK